MGEAWLISVKPAAMLVNQHLQLVRTHWGFFDMRIGNVAVSNRAAGIGFGTLGVALIFIGMLLMRRRRKTRPKAGANGR